MEVFHEWKEKLLVVVAIGIALGVVVPTFGYVVFVMAKISFALRSRAAYRKFQRRTLAKQILKIKIRQRKDAERRSLGKASGSGLLIGGLILTFAFAISVSAFDMLSNFIRAKQWSAADCTVLSLIMQPTYGKNPGGARPQIVYAFKVGDATFTGSRYEFFNTVFSGEEISVIENNYQPGKHFSCFYNPSDPQESVAVQTTPAASLEIMTIISLLICYPLGAFLFYDSLPGKTAEI